jgi:hypothetical protein
MHGPTCIFWANLTPFSLQRQNVIAAVFGFAVFAAGIVLFSVGLACLDNTLYGIEQCDDRVGRTMALFGAGVTAAMVVPATVYILGKHSSMIVKVSVAIIVGVTGLMMGTYGTACKNCDKDAALLLMVAGWGLLFILGSGGSVWFVLVRVLGDDPDEEAGWVAIALDVKVIQMPLSIFHW